MKFKVGDRIITRKKCILDGGLFSEGEVGIIKVVTSYNYGIYWLTWDSGHSDLGGLIGHSWYSNIEGIDSLCYSNSKDMVYDILLCKTCDRLLDLSNIDTIIGTKHEKHELEKITYKQYDDLKNKTHIEILK